MITLTRDYKNNKTIGILTMPDGYQIKTLERPDQNNQVDISCIPEGIYKFKRDKTGRHQWFAILDVPGRTHIEIHPGNKVSHSNGCILMSKYDCEVMAHWFDDVSETYVLEIK